MDPLNHLNAMYFQESLTTALDLSMGCKQIPAEESSVEALDLVNKSIRSKCISGIRNKIMGVPETGSEGHISQPFQQVQFGDPQSDLKPDIGYASRSCSMLLHNPNPLNLLNGLPLVTHISPQRPNTDPLLEEDGTTETDGTFTNHCENPLKALIAASEGTKTDTDQPLKTKVETRRGEKSVPNGLHSQSWGLKKYATRVPPKTGTKGCLGPQDDTSSPSLHSISPLSIISEDSTLVEKFLMHSQTTVESLSSGCISSRVNSPFSVESISSYDSDVIEVPVTNSQHKQYINGHLLTGIQAAKYKSQETETLSIPSLEFVPVDSSDCSTPKPLNETDLPKYAEALESVEASPSILLQDSDQETDASISKVLPSTSDADNTDILKSLQEGVLSRPPLVEDTPQKALPLKKKKQTKPGPKRKPQAKQTKPSPGSKSTSSAAKRRKRKPQTSGPSSSMFSAQEPEIKLKYANCKQDKKENKDDSFAPYVRVDLSDCTVVNFQEDVKEAVRAKKRQRATGPSVSSGTVPTSSKLQLGRVRTDARCRDDQTCCLCGQMANVAGLGDLHGPYHPCQPQFESRNHLSIYGRAIGQLLVESPAKTHELLYSDQKPPSKRMKKRYSPDECPAAPEEDLDECRERWVHEDCSIWSAGVFLVKGKLYGLEEAVRLAQESVCSCCHKAGATLGCFFKGCPNKYHFPCAVQAECALNEDNFTIRCPRHKNKISTSSISRLQNR